MSDLDKNEEVKLTVAEERKIEEIEIEDVRIPEGILAAIANKYDHGKKEAILAQARRVSKRMLMSGRARKMTLVCPVTGIVSLLDIPVIPGCFLPYEHPLSTLENARTLTQRGPDYLKILDTRTLAGMLIVLAEAYDLFKFLPKESGAEKNAILRTAGKEAIIDTLLVIEGDIHSRNRHHVPVLSLLPDTVNQGNRGADIRLHNWLSLVTESLKKPDTSVYDENAKPKKIGRPVYTRDVNKATKKLSYLARLEYYAAKKELAADAKEAKKLASTIVALGLLKPAFKGFIYELFSNDGMGLTTLPKESMLKLLDKLIPAQEASKEVAAMIEILQKDRKILSVEIMEIDDLDSPAEEDDPKPGQENAVAEEEEELEAAGYSEEEAIETLEAEEEIAPEGLSKLELILWNKKNKVKKNTYSQPVAPEVKAVYIPKDVATAVVDEPLTFSGYSKDRQFLIYNSAKIPSGVYFIHNDYGFAILAKTTLPYGFDFSEEI